LVPADAWRSGGVTWLTAFFLHGGWLHLVSNVYFLLVFGDNVEDNLGHGRYLVLLILAAAVGDVTHLLADPHSTIPSIGASGGISGVIAYYALKFPHARLGFLWSYYWSYHWVSIPAWSAFAVWALLQGVGIFEQLSGFSHVSAAAHLGGAVTGLVFWLAARRSMLNGRQFR
jgi:membrane associated rhomboid family serine protease